NKKTTSIFIGARQPSTQAIQLYDHLKFSNLMKNSIIFVSRINELAGSRMSIVPIGVTPAEYLRDTQKENLLLFIDNIFTFLQAANQMSASLDKKPSLEG
ncbi:F0F1 ATP synthase subunit beta, partial [Mycoplasmopsis synoviae]